MLMIKYRKATNDVANGDLAEASRKLTIRKGGEQFASLPGGSQSNGMTLNKMKELFKKNVSNELTGQSNVGTPVGQLTKPN